MAYETKTIGMKGASEMKFIAKALMSIEELDTLQIEHENGWVKGNLLDSKWIVGEVVEADQDYIQPAFWVTVDSATISPYLSKEEYQSKHQAFNLHFKEHEVFKESCVIVDQSDIPVLWIKKETGEVSFGGGYFHLYREQRLIEILSEFAEIADHLIHGKNHEHLNFAGKFKKALEAKRELEMEFFKQD